MTYYEDVPPAGTRCASCEDHFCAAKCYCGNETPLCMGCANGSDCDVVRARRMTEDELLGRFNSPATEVRDVTPVITSVGAADRVVIDKPVETRRSDSGRAIGLGSASLVSRKLEAHEIAKLVHTKPEGAIQILEPNSDVAKVAKEEGKVMPEKAERKIPERLSFEALQEIEAAANTTERTSDLAKRLRIEEAACWY